MLRLALSLAGLAFLSACSKNSSSSSAQLEQVYQGERSAAGGKSAISGELKEGLAKGEETSLLEGKARIAVLYYLDRPANRQAVLDWLKESQAKVVFESQRFGYLDAEVEWAGLDKLIKTAIANEFDTKLFLRLELDQVKAPGAEDPRQAKAPGRAAKSPQVAGQAASSSLFGPAHSAGYGAKVAEFRSRAAADLGLGGPAALAGQGVVVSVFDMGIDLSRTDVFQGRIRDFLVADERDWVEADKGLEDLKKAGFSIKGLEKELADPAIAETMKFVEISTKEDLNGAGLPEGKFWAVVFQEKGEWTVKVEVASDSGFGDALLDFGRARALKKPQILDLESGRFYSRSNANPSRSAVGVKIRKTGDAPELAFVGQFNDAEHGIANLHMVGGSVDLGNVKYQGVAPGVEFLGMKTWTEGGYGQHWTPFARSIIQAVEAGADILDLDVYTPGTRGGNDLLSALLCRITRTTNTVPLVAAHNYGPLPNTVQNLAQSPCVLAVGAAHSVAATREGYGNAAIDPALVGESALQTALYSGRGFGQNGLLKPDIIAPAYGYTAYGSQFFRFGGTSGATPATSGAIALLKQAARAKGVELGFSQVKMLLQGSSVPVTSAHARDGFGYLDLEAAWSLFQAFYANDKKLDSLSPVLLSGERRLQFEGRPERNVYSLELTRVAALGSQDQPVPMTFWIEYGGDSSGQPAWLKFYDSAQGSPTDTMKKDIPSHGNTQNLRLAFALDTATWNALPAGDHIAIVKGVRSSLYGKSRAVDFALPVTIEKPIDLEESQLAVAPLYDDQYRIFSFATSPGERLFVSGQFRCEGDAAPSALVNGLPDPLEILVDNEAGYGHASQVMNTYNSMQLSSTPLAITAGRGVTRVALVRYGAHRCPGGISGRIVARRTGFRLASPEIDLRRDEDKLHISASAQITLSQRAGALENTEYRRGVLYRLKVAKMNWVLRKKVVEKTTVELPSGTESVRVLPDNASRFVGALVSLDKDGSSLESANTDESYLSGLSAETRFRGGKYSGLVLSDLDKAKQVAYLPASASARLGGTLELSVKSEGEENVELSPAKAESWNGDEGKKLTFKADFPSGLEAWMQDFPAEEWSAELQVQLAVSEEAQRGRDEVVEGVGMTIWRGTLAIPVAR